MNNQKSGKIIFIVGPTAVGKSNAAVSLAKKINGEIISCDSMQVYKGMRIISSYPDKNCLKTVRHHLIAEIPASKEFNVARYRVKALDAVKKIRASGKIPIFVGGTGLYMSVLVDGIFKAKAADKKIRERLYRESKKFGSSYLHKRLSRVDKEAGIKIHPNDEKRIIRALEVFESSGKPISQLQKDRKGLAHDYDVRIFCLNSARDVLYRLIDKRVEKMFADGAIDEVNKLLKLRLSKTSRTALGIREIEGSLNGEYSTDKAKELLKLNTRHYAKRQLTWFRKDKRIEWVNILPSEKAGQISNRIWKKLS